MGSWNHMVVFLACVLTIAQSYKILIYPIQMKSHLILFGEISKALIEKHHSVHMLVPSHTTVPSGLHPDLKILTYPVSMESSFFDSKELNELVTEMLKKLRESFFAYMSIGKELGIRFNHNLNSDCEDLINNAAFVNRLKEEKYDLVLLDAVNYVCPTALIYKLGLPIVTSSIPFFQWSYGVPFLPSISPKQMTDSTDKMTFYERFTNLGHEIFDAAFINTTSYYIEKYVPEKEIKPGSQILQESLFWFYTYDSILLYPRPNMPNTLEIADIVGRPGSPLPKEYQQILENANHGVVLMALGSYFDHLPKEWVLKFCDAFHKIDSRVIVLWKMKIKPECSLPANVITKTWIPQNDVLAHPKTKLFITHCGSNSYTEAVYHAKPMVAIPLGIDQPHNALAMQTKGLGIRMDVLNFTADELAQNINTVLTNKSYAQAAKKLSARLRNRPIATKELVAFWVEHVIQHGGEHLRSSAHELSMFEFLMLDILGLLLLACVITIIITVISCCLVVRICQILCSKRKNKAKKE